MGDIRIAGCGEVLETDSSNEEWEEEFWSANASSTVPLDAEVDTRGMLENAFAIDDPINDIEDRVH